MLKYIVVCVLTCLLAIGCFTTSTAPVVEGIYSVNEYLDAYNPGTCRGAAETTGAMVVSYVEDDLMSVHLLGFNNSCVGKLNKNYTLTTSCVVLTSEGFASVMFDLKFYPNGFNGYMVFNGNCIYNYNLAGTKK